MQQTKVIKSLLNRSGMTLLEVIIAMAIFGMLAFSLMRMTDVSVRYRSKLAVRVQQTRLTRSVIQILRKDLRNMFFVDDVNARLALVHFSPHSFSASKPANPTEDRGRSIFSSWNPPSPLGTGGLIGDAATLKMMSFPIEPERDSLKELRTYTIMYHVKACPNQKANCLWRYVLSDSSTLSNTLDMHLGNNKDSGRVLLKNVKTFQLAYLNIFDNQWKQEWPTDSQERPFLPAAIKILLEFQDLQKKQVKESLTIAIYQRLLSLRMMSQ